MPRREFFKLVGLSAGAAALGGTGLGFLVGRYTRLFDMQTAPSSPTVYLRPTLPYLATRPSVPAGDTPMTVITPDVQGFENFLPTNIDSLGDSSFKDFLGNPAKLVDAWTVNGSIYTPNFRLDTLESIKYAPAGFLPRWSEYEVRSLGRLDIAGIIRDYGLNNTAFILDSGGAHSLAMAYELAKKGCQPVPMLRGIPCKFENCATSGASQDVAVALYLATEMLGITQKLQNNAPPVFIWDGHRSSPAIGNEINNSYSFKLSDMPDADFLSRQGIRNIIVVNEAKRPIIEKWNNRGYDKDWSQIPSYYQDKGFNVLSLGISPTP